MKLFCHRVCECSALRDREKCVFQSCSNLYSNQSSMTMFLLIHILYHASQYFAILVGVQCYIISPLICIYISKRCVRFFICLLDIDISFFFLRSACFMYLSQLSIGLFVFFLFTCTFHIFQTLIIRQLYALQIASPSQWLPFPSLVFLVNNGT